MSLTRSKGLLSVIAILLVLSCNRGTTRAVWLYSPNGNLQANTVEVPGWGATNGPGYLVVLNPRSRPFNSRRLGPPVWSSYQVPVKYLFWRDNMTLEVVVSPENRDYFDTIRVATIEGVTVVTTVLDGTSKREVFEAVPIEVQGESASPGS